MLLTILVLCVCLLYFYTKYFCVKNVSVFPNSVPFLGHSLLFQKDLFLLIKKLGEHAVDNSGVTTVLLGPKPMYVIADPVKATVILSTCLEKLFIYKLITPLFGKELVQAPVPIWKQNRRIADLAFKPQVLNGYLALFNTQALNLIEIIDEKSSEGYLDLTDDITRNVLETAFQSTMGQLPQDQNYSIKKYVIACHKVFEIVTQRLQKPWMIFDFLFYLSSAKTEMNEALKVIFETSTKMVSLRKLKYLERIKNGNKSTRNEGQLISFLDIVIENSMSEKGSLYTDIQLRCLTDNVLIAAFDTTIYELLYTLVCVGSHEEVQRKIYQEIIEVLGEEETVGKEHLSKLTYLESAIKESIRLYPIAPVVGRQATEKVLLDSATLPAGSWVVVHLWAINRHKSYWGPDAEEFNPDRWLKPETLPEHPNAFGSFSFGRRNCIGKMYAMMHLKTTLVPILRKYRIFSDHKKMEFDCITMLKVKSGHLIKFELR